MVDQTLIDQYAAAVAARSAVERLPPGLREYAQQFELMLLDDIRAQAGNPDLTETDFIKKEAPKLLTLALQIGVDVAKKHWPTALISTVLSALASWFTTVIQK